MDFYIAGFGAIEDCNNVGNNGGAPCGLLSLGYCGIV